MLAPSRKPGTQIAVESWNPYEASVHFGGPNSGQQDLDDTAQIQRVRKLLVRSLLTQSIDMIHGLGRDLLLKFKIFAI
jgi:hypothetical protein